MGLLCVAHGEDYDKYGTPGHIDVACRKQPSTDATQQKESTKTEPHISQPQKKENSSDGMKMDVEARGLSPFFLGCKRRFMH